MRSPSKCEICGREFMPTRAAMGARFCSPVCRGQARRKPSSELVHKYRKTNINGRGEFIHRLVFLEAHGVGPHQCHWCKSAVTMTRGARTRRGALVVDHLDGNGLNNTPENLVPSCHACNVRRTHPNRLQGDELYITWDNGTRHRAVEVECRVCGTKFITIARAKGQATLCSRSCVGRVPKSYPKHRKPRRT